MTVRPFNINTYYRRITRARYHARGLNSQGRRRRNSARPELRGLRGAEYHRQYMRLWRNEE